MIAIEYSTAPVARRLKVLIYGASGTGKTWFALHAPSPLVIDTEGGTGAYRGRADLPPFTVAASASPRDVATLLERYAAKGAIENGGEALRPETVVIDTLSALWLAAQGVGQRVAEARAAKYKRPPEEARLAFGDWGLIKRPIQRLYALLPTLPAHVIVTARLKDVYDGESGGDAKKIDEAPDIERNAIYTFDVVIKLEELAPGKRVGLVQKSRFGAALPVGTRIPDPSWSSLAHLVHSEPVPENGQPSTAADAARTPGKTGPAEWMRHPANRQRTLDWLAENGLSEADASAALGIDDWRETTLSAEAFKAAVEAYVANQLTGGDAPDDGAVDETPPEAAADESPASETKAAPKASSKTAPASAPHKCANCGVDEARDGEKYCPTCADLLAKAGQVARE